MARIFISVGSNINKEHNIEVGLNALAEHFSIQQCSSLYESHAVGFEGDNFFNLVIEATTNKPVAEVVSIFKSIEKANGRVDFTKKFSARIIDLDLLLYDDLVMSEPAQLPRFEITENAYVLLPLSEIAGERCHPLLEVDFETLWQRFDQQKHKLWQVPFNWQVPTSHSICK